MDCTLPADHPPACPPGAGLCLRPKQHCLPLPDTCLGRARGLLSAAPFSPRHCCPGPGFLTRRQASRHAGSAGRGWRTVVSGLPCLSWEPWAADVVTVHLPQGTMATAPWPCGAWPPTSLCPPRACQSQYTAWPSTPGTLASSPAWARVPSPCGFCSSVGATSASRCQGSEEALEDGVWLDPRASLTHTVLVSLQVHREPIPEEVGGCKLTSLCYGTTPLLYCGSSAGQVCVWDMCAGCCFLAWEADDGEIGGCLTEPPWPLTAWGSVLPGSPSAGAVDTVLSPRHLGTWLMASPVPQECCCAWARVWSVAATPGGCACGPWGPYQS